MSDKKLAKLLAGSLIVAVLFATVLPVAGTKNAENIPPMPLVGKTIAENLPPYPFAPKIAENLPPIPSAPVKTLV